jgi:hypothetical protein
LTVGQLDVARWLFRDGPGPFDISVRLIDLPDDVTAEGIRTALSVLIGRHEALRTLFPVEGVQSVLDRGTIEVDFAEDPGDLLSMVTPRPFEPDRELPLRATVLTCGGRPASVLFFGCHLSVDEAAMEIVAREFRTLLTGGVLPPSAPQPADLAAEQRTPMGARRLHRSLRYWEEQCLEAPLCALPVPDTETTGRYTVRLTSRSAGRAIEELGAQLRVSPQSAVTAVFMLALTEWTGQSAALVNSISGNRHLPRLRDYVGTLAQDSISVFRREGRTLHTLLADTNDTLLNGFRYGMFHPADLDALLADVEAETSVARQRGAHRHRDVVVNNMTGGTGLAIPLLDRLSTAPGARRLHDRAGTTLTVLPGAHTGMTDPVRLDCYGFAPVLDLTLSADSSLVPPSQVGTFALAVVELLLTASASDADAGQAACAVGVTPLQRAGSWARAGGSWTNLGAVRAALATALPVPASLEVRDGQAVAVLDTAPGRSAATLRTAVLKALGAAHGVAAPALLCTG